MVAVTDEHGARTQSVAKSTILNRDPSIQSIEISETIYNTEEVSCTVSAHDPDEEELSYSYVWENLTTQVELGTTQNLVLSSSMASVGDEIRCTASIEDAMGRTDSAMISGVVQNRAPLSPIVTLTPFPSVEGDDLSCSYTTPEDPDGDSITITQTWYVNGSLVQEEGEDLTTVMPLDGEIVECTIVLVDAHEAQTTTTDSLIVGYTPPSVESITLTDPAYTHKIGRAHV